MKSLASLLPVLLCGLLAMPALAAKRKYGDSANNSDALFDPSRVIQIEIRLDPKDWHALRVSHPIRDETGTVSITEKGYKYYRADIGIDGQVVKSIGVRKKGAIGSVASNRPGLKIKFDEYVKDQEFAGLDMLTLNNCVGDPSKAQQFLVYSFMSKAGVPAPRSNFARVIVNGEDLGIYANVESIRKPLIKRYFTDAKGDLYEPRSGADLTTNTTAWIEQRIEHKWGKDEDFERIRQLVDVLERPGKLSLMKIEELVDVDAFLSFWAAEVLSGCFDGYAVNANNYYLYRSNVSGKFHFIPWGRDTAFRDPGFWLPPTVPKSVKAQAYLCRRLWELPEIRERYRHEMRRLLADVWDEKSLLADLERVQQQRRNDQVFEPAKIKADVDRITRFIQGRRKEVEAELSQPSVDWPIPRRDSARSVTSGSKSQPMLVEGSFSTTIAESLPLNLGSEYLGQGSATLQYTVRGEPHSPFTRLGAAAMTRYSELELIVVRILALDAVGGLRWNLAFRIEPHRITSIPATLELGEWIVWAPLSQGEPGSQNFQLKYASENKGTLELTQVSTNLGGTISGKFTIHTTAFEEEKKP